MREIHRLQSLKDWTLQARDGEIGRFQQVYFDDQEWQVRYLVVLTGGWLFGRSVLIERVAVVEVETEAKRFIVDLTREQIEASPSLDMGVPHLADEDNRSRQSARPHLRISDEVLGYDVLTRNGRLGHVLDLLLDDESWQVRYAEVDTRNWWPGKKVLVAPTWIEEIRWTEREISVSLSREAIRDAPEYDPSVMITPEFEVELFEYYSHAADNE